MIEQETKGLLNQILSIVTELLQEEKGEMDIIQEELTETGTTPVEGKEKIVKNCGTKIKKESKMDDKEDEEELEKSIISSPSEGGTADEGEEKRRDSSLTDIDEESLSEVAKSIAKEIIAKRKQQVKKSASSNLEINKLTQCVKSLTEKVMIQEQAFTKLLQGFGLAENIIQKSEPVQKIEKGLNNSSDIQALANFIAKATKQETKEEDINSGNPMNDVRKSLDNGFYQDLLTFTSRRK